jgi:hypothetical protein
VQLLVQCVSDGNQKTAPEGRFEIDFLVTRAGFEPAISTLRGWAGTPPTGSHGVATSSKWPFVTPLRSPSGAVGRPGCYPRCYPR